MRVRRSDANDELGIRPEMLGHAEAQTDIHLTEAEKKQARKERQEAAARRYPLGFRPQEERP